MVYSFKEQLALGQSDENRLDQHFRQFFVIVPASSDEQRTGIDRHYIKDKRTYSVEYKSDRRAKETGHAFIETVSVDANDKPGWIYTSQATYLFYFVPNDDLVYMLTLRKMRNQLPRWERECRSVAVPNEGYSTVGLLVDIGDIERCAIASVEVK